MKAAVHFCASTRRVVMSHPPRNPSEEWDQGKPWVASGAYRHLGFENEALGQSSIWG